MEVRARVVVGVDGSDNARAALFWSMNEAVRRDATLDVVCAWLPVPVVAPLGLPGPLPDDDAYETAAKELLDDFVLSAPAELRLAVPDLQPIATRGAATETLLAAARGADLLVVGARGHGLAKRLGSVSHQCVHHAPCPVTVVPAGWPAERTPRRVVCGVEASEGAAAALEWAMREASRWDAQLTIAHSWTTPYPIEPWGMVVTPRDRDAFQRSALLLIEDMVDAAVEADVPRPSSIERLPIEDAAGPALVAAAKDADLLVVGSRGRGGFAALLVGSVSLHCVRHAGCPITVVRLPHAAAPGAR